MQVRVSVFALAEVHLDYNAVKSGYNWHTFILLLLVTSPLPMQLAPINLYKIGKVSLYFPSELVSDIDAKSAAWV